MQFSESTLFSNIGVTERNFKVIHPIPRIMFSTLNFVILWNFEKIEAYNIITNDSSQWINFIENLMKFVYLFIRFLSFFTAISFLKLLRTLSQLAQFWNNFEGLKKKRNLTFLIKNSIFDHFSKRRKNRYETKPREEKLYHHLLSKLERTSCIVFYYHHYDY